MKLNNDNIDYGALINVHEELAIVMADVVGVDWYKTSNDALLVIEGLNNVQWAIFDPNKAYVPVLRTICAACMYLLIEIAERNERH